MDQMNKNHLFWHSIPACLPLLYLPPSLAPKKWRILHCGKFKQQCLSSPLYVMTTSKSHSDCANPKPQNCTSKASQFLWNFSAKKWQAVHLLFLTTQLKLNY